MNYSKLTALLFALALPAAVLAQGNDAAKPNPDVEKAIIKIENDMSAALTKPDADAAAKMLADTFYAVNPDGSTQGKAQFLADLKSGKFKLESNQLDDMKVHAADADMAIVTYRSTDKGSYDGQDLSGQYRCSISLRNAAEPGSSSFPRARKSNQQRSRKACSHGAVSPLSDNRTITPSTPGGSSAPTLDDWRQCMSKTHRATERAIHLSHLLADDAPALQFLLQNPTALRSR